MREKTKSELLDELHKINVKINKFSKDFALCRESSVNEIIASQNFIADWNKSLREFRSKMFS